MDKIFKNDKIMGVVAVATLVLVGIMFYTSQKGKDAVTVTLPNSQTSEE